MKSSQRASIALPLLSLCLPVVLSAQSQVRDRPVAAMTNAISSETTLPTTDEPAERFAAARVALARHAPAQATAEIRDATTFVRAQAAVASGAIRSDLEESARELDQISARVRNGTLKTPRELDLALRRSDRGLARHHLDRAMRAWKRQQWAETSQALNLAAQYTERLAQDANTDVERATTLALESTRRVAGTLGDRTTRSKEEVERTFAALGREIDRLGADSMSRQ